jgi:hypothetical protein
MPRLKDIKGINAVPQGRLLHQKMLTAEQALKLGATAYGIGRR